MQVIARRRLQEFASRYKDAKPWLDRWYGVANTAEWDSIEDVRRTFPHADPVTVGSGKTVTVFNACGNKYRLVTAIHYNRKKVFVLRFLTHAEYSKDSWKESL